MNHRGCCAPAGSSSDRLRDQLLGRQPIHGAAPHHFEARHGERDVNIQRRALTVHRDVDRSVHDRECLLGDAVVLMPNHDHRLFRILHLGVPRRFIRELQGEELKAFCP